MDFLNIKKENKRLKKEIKRLKKLCSVKDSYFLELMSDALRHGSKLASKHMRDRKLFLHGK